MWRVVYIYIYITWGVKNVHTMSLEPVLRLCFPIINEPLVLTLNSSLTVRFSLLKITNVSLVCKADDNMIFNKPVSLLCILSKIFRIFMYDRLSSFFEKSNKILLNNQFWFRRHNYTYMALMILLD